MNKKIKSLHQKWKEALAAAEIAAKIAEEAAATLKIAIEKEQEELNKLYPSEISKPAIPPAEAPSDAPSSKLWSIREIQALLDFPYETVAQYWPAQPHEEVTTSEINAVLTRLGRRPIEDYL